MMSLTVNVNGRRRRVEASGETPLLWVLREELGLVGAKFGCGIGSCGACTVHIDGVAVRACTVPVESVGGAKITTIEGLARGETLHPVQQAWLEEDVAQCGYCQTGQIMATVELLARNPDPTDKDIDEAITNLCRCGTYPRIRKAVHRAARLARGA